MRLPALAFVLATSTSLYADSARPPRITPVTTMFVATAQPLARELVAPWSLTASDGSGLVMTRIDARAVVEGPLAFTELHLYFHNPEARQREGTFAITLPAGAAVSRFAMEQNGQFMEAEVVEKHLAQIAYEDFLHRKQDPALLEKGAGNQFTARVFPIPAKADKHLVISYSQEVSPGHYALPLRGLARAERVDVRVQVRGASGDVAEQTMSQRNWTPDRDVVVDATKVGAPRAIAAGDIVAARVTVALPSAQQAPAAMTLLVDTSASRALGFAAQGRAIQKLVDTLAKTYGGGFPIQLVAYDQTTAQLYDGRADKLGDVEHKLAARGALGASDLGQALAWLAQHAPKSRVVLVGDGVITAGAKLEALPAQARQLGARGVERIDVALVGGIRDEAAAAAVAQAGLKYTGAVLDLDRGADEVARRLALAVRTEVPVSADNARWVFPRSLAAVQAGDEVTVYVRRNGSGPVALSVGGAKEQLATVAVMPTLLGRAFASAEIAELDARLAKASGDAADKLRADIVKRSVAARVVSSQTSLLVLESDRDYERYGIDRRALADILAIGPTGVELLHHSAVIAAPEQPVLSKADKRKQRMKDGDEPAESPKKMAARADEEDDASSVEVVEGGVVGGSLGGVAVRNERNARPSADARAMPRPEPRAADLGVRRSEARVASASASGVSARAREAEQETITVTGSAPARGVAAGSGAATRAPAPDAPPPPPMATRPAPSPGPRGQAYVAARAELAESRPMELDNDNDDGFAENRRKPSLAGPLAEIERALAGGRVDAALAQATAWHKREPGDVLALIGLGDALEAKRDLDTAARVYGSIIDLFPARADFRRFAGERLERLGQAQRKLIVDSYQRAVAQRPDHLTGHRLLAYALVRDGQWAAAFTAILAGLDRQYPDNRFAGAERVLAEDAGMIGAAYAAHVPGARATVMAELGKRRLALATSPSTRFLMYWETDANDVDFHIRDARGGHAWYSHKQLPSGGELYADITTGYGPECFAINGAPKAGPYKLSINYYSQGPMGYGMGLLQIQRFDGQGNLSFEDRPYVIMTDHAFVDLGSYKP